MLTAKATTRQEAPMLAHREAVFPGSSETGGQMRDAVLSLQKGVPDGLNRDMQDSAKVHLAAEKMLIGPP